MRTLFCKIRVLTLLGYRQLFQPVIKQVVDFYQPTCIVLQVRKYPYFENIRLSFKLISIIDTFRLIVGYTNIDCSVEQTRWAVTDSGALISVYEVMGKRNLTLYKDEIWQA